MIIPIVDQSNGTYAATFLGVVRTMKTNEEREELERNIRFNGYYPYRTTQEEVAKLQADKKLVDTLFSEMMKEGIKRWVGIAENRLKGTKTKCYISPGNDDRFDIDDILKSSPSILYPEDEVLWVDDKHEMITSAWTNVSPWNSPRNFRRETGRDFRTNDIKSYAEWKMQSSTYTAHLTILR